MGGLIYLLDTNILSEPVKPQPNPRVMARLSEFRENCATASLVWHELHCGWTRMAPSKKSRTVGAYLERLLASRLPVLDYDARAAEWHAAERARLMAAGVSTPFVDGQIAAIAKVNGLTLATRNVGDFDSFEGLELADWFGEDTTTVNDSVG